MDAKRVKISFSKGYIAWSTMGFSIRSLLVKKKSTADQKLTLVGGNEIVNEEDFEKKYAQLYKGICPLRGWCFFSACEDIEPYSEERYQAKRILPNLSYRRQQLSNGRWRQQPEKQHDKRRSSGLEKVQKRSTGEHILRPRTRPHVIGIGRTESNRPVYILRIWGRESRLILFEPGSRDLTLCPLAVVPKVEPSRLKSHVLKQAPSVSTVAAANHDRGILTAN